MTRAATVTLGAVGLALAFFVLAWAWRGYTDAGFLLLLQRLPFCG